MLNWILLLCLSLTPWTGVDVERDRAKFEKRHHEALLEAGKRHLDIGLWCRDKGLTTQSAFEIMRAVEISNDQHPHAKAVLRVMRQYDQGFWKKRKKGGTALRKSYETRALKARKKDQGEFLDLASWAWKRKLREEGLQLYRDLVLETGEALRFDSNERLLLEFGTIPEEASALLRAEAISINDKLYLRDEFLAALPELEAIYEVDGERLRVRGTEPLERLEELHRLGLALLPHLEEELRARPSRRLDLFLFSTRANYDAWLEAAGLTGHKAGSGLADPRWFVTVVCGEELEPPIVDALVLHELTHLFWYGVSRTVMPDWFDEGFAETFGGPGSFAWEGEELKVGQLLGERELERLRDPAALFSLRELLAGDALALLTADEDRGRLYYVQSWALLRFFREGASDKLGERFDTWVTMCLGSAAGAKTGDVRARNREPAAQSFMKLFGEELPAIEDAFRTWLKGL